MWQKVGPSDSSLRQNKVPGIMIKPSQYTSGKPRKGEGVAEEMYLISLLLRSKFGCHNEKKNTIWYSQCKHCLIGFTTDSCYQGDSTK